MRFRVENMGNTISDSGLLRRRGLREEYGVGFSDDAVKNCKILINPLFKGLLCTGLGHMM